jgi:hypothetical protein
MATNLPRSDGLVLVPEIPGMNQVRNGLFLCAIVMMNYTIMRPSPVDLIFVMVAFTCLFINQIVTVGFVVLLLVLGSWTLGFYAASVPFFGNPEVRFELLAKTFVVIISLISCYVSIGWRETDYNKFIKVYVISCSIGAVLGIVGFVSGIETLTWDGRARGLIDDPNMYASFLVPGVLCCMYLIDKRMHRLLVSVALLLMLLAIFVAFSRAALGALIVCGGLYMAILNRNNIARAALWMALGLVIAVVVLGIAALVFENFAEKLADRSTVAKEYDLGRDGRYGRYLLSIPIILDNPMGIGILADQRYFPEPIHNIFISSFLNYGWIGGFAWLTLVGLSFGVAWRNYKTTRHPLATLLSLAVLSQLLCASLHEGEHWRHMWLFIGLLWGFSGKSLAAR